MIPQKQLRKEISFTDVPLESDVGEQLEDDLLKNNNNETYQANPFVDAQPHYHIYIPKESTPSQFTCCCRDPILCGITILIVFVLVMLCVVIIIIKN